LAKWFFGGLGYQGQKTTLVQENRGLLALPLKAARPKKQDYPENVRVLAVVPQASKKTLG
jgi:hypothetical protein